MKHSRFVLSLVALLLALAPERAVGADLRAWRVAALLALELLAGQQVLPGLQREGFQLRASWVPRPTPQVAHKLAEFTLSNFRPPVIAV